MNSSLVSSPSFAMRKAEVDAINNSAAQKVVHPVDLLKQIESMNDQERVEFIDKNRGVVIQLLCTQNKKALPLLKQNAEQLMGICFLEKIIPGMEIFYNIENRIPQPDAIQLSSDMSTAPMFFCEGISEDVCANIDEELTAKDYISLALTSTSNNKRYEKICLSRLDTTKPEVTRLRHRFSAAEIFRRYPQHRKEKYLPYDLIGQLYIIRTYLHIGPTAFKQIVVGTLTIAQAEQQIERSGSPNKLNRAHTMSERLAFFRQQFLSEGLLNKDDATRKLSPFESGALTCLDVRGLIFLGILSAESILKLTDTELSNLMFIARLVIHGLLTVEQSVGLEFSESERLEKLNQIIIPGIRTIKDCLSLSDDEFKSLAKDVQLAGTLFESRTITIEQFSAASEGERTFFQYAKEDPRVREMTFDEIKKLWDQHPVLTDCDWIPVNLKDRELGIKNALFLHYLREIYRLGPSELQTVIKPQ